jgi:hypothetical protein
MTNCKRRCWAERTYKGERSYLLSELQQGRLRQGWGGNPLQDLRLIQAEIEKDGKWWERLSEYQKEALPQLRMLSSAKDSVQLGDWILVPNLPEDGYFLVAEVVGEYYYDPKNAFEHVLPVRLLTDKGINKYSEYVHADIRATLKTPMRMWNIDRLGNALEKLIEEYKTGIDLSTAKSGEARLATAWDVARTHAVDELQKHLKAALDARFQAAEWEEPIKMVLKNLYPGADIRKTAGPGEHGADLVVQIPNHFGATPWLIIVQVKNYTGEIGKAVLEQLRDAYDKYSKEGTVLSLVAMTTAEKTSADFQAAAASLEKELSVPVEMVLQKGMMEMFSAGLFPDNSTYSV